MVKNENLTFASREEIWHAGWNLGRRQVEAELNQQRFNNEHNLSIDQKISDRIQSLEAELRVARSYRGRGGG